MFLHFVGNLLVHTVIHLKTSQIDSIQIEVLFYLPIEITELTPPFFASVSSGCVSLCCTKMNKNTTNKKKTLHKGQDSRIWGILTPI